MDHMTGAIGSLLPKLGELLKQEHILRTIKTPIKKYIDSLDRQLRIMEDALVRMPRAHNWSYQLRELPYDIEDNVDHLLLCIDEGQQEVTQPAIIKKDSFKKKTLKNIKVRVKKLAAWLAANSVPMTTRTVEPCPEDGFKEVRQLVGIHKLKAELISTISSSSQQLKIVSVWGAGGMGKTTLAKAVYENIEGDFDYTAFVSLGMQPYMTKALRDILMQLDKQQYGALDDMDELLLINELRYFLEDKRFLIVVDDIREITSWEVFKLALVDNGCGSRIITTSRVLGVAESSGEVLKLKPLSIDGSKELFYATLYSHKCTVSFDHLSEFIPEFILQKCGGVPLAIIMMASLLAGKPRKEWIKVCHSIGFDHGDNNISADENTRKIIQFCYYGLPSHLKTCLLYLSIFPNEHVIEKDTLVWRWIAEGFGHVWIAPWQAADDLGPRRSPKWERLLCINTHRRPFVHDDREQEESLFKVGERYFYELVSRCMIQAIENEGSFLEKEQMRSCRVEGMVLEWIRFVAQEQDFVNIASGDWYDHRQHLFSGEISNYNARIMAVQSGVLDNPYGQAGMSTKPQMRSFNVIGCSGIMGMAGLQPFFQVLRVLSIEGCMLMSLHDGLQYVIEGLLHLRYLGLRGTHIRRLPEKIGGLRYLQTLDLTRTYITELPSSVTQLRQLKCLRCFVYELQLPQGMGNLTALEELQLGGVKKSPYFAKELSKLTELRVLHIFNSNRESSDGKWMEALVKTLSKLQKIEELELFYDELSSDMMTCRHVIAPDGFPRIRHLRTNTWLMYQPGAMPCLKSVELEVCVRDFNDANFDLHDFSKLSYLRLLEKAHVGINCRKAKMEEVEEAEAALRRVLESHPNHPKLFLRRTGQCVEDEEEQCENYKQIRFFGGLHGSEAGPQVMPLELLRQITNNFSNKQKLGSGAFGTVYKGVLEGKELAVKRLHSMSQRLDYEEDFKKEFENLSRLDHANIVRLLGYCYEIKRVCVKYDGKYVLADDTYRALCFDYMHNGSLQQHLDDESLGWQTCYKIIKGTCEGLKYLHKGLEKPMFHLDLKPGNILLDKNMMPKLADFGLSKLVCDNQTQATSNFLGTIGYCPPEHIERYCFSDKFDIFSLGVIMIEIIYGTKGHGKAVEKGSQAFIDDVQKNWRERIHPITQGTEELEEKDTSGCNLPNCECQQVKRCIEIALECVNDDRMQRPDIEGILSRLNETETILRNQP